MAKKVRKVVEGRVAEVLADLPKGLSEKKFMKHVKKAGKILSDGLTLPDAAPAKKKNKKKLV